MRRTPNIRPENQVALATAEIERLKAITTRVTDGRVVVTVPGVTPGDGHIVGPDLPPLETSAHVLFGSKHTNSLLVTAAEGISLTIFIEAGQVWASGTFVSLSATTLQMADANTNYVHIDNVGVVASNTTSFPSDSTPLAEVVAAGGTITAINDRRTYFTQGGWGGGAILGNPLIVGIDDTTHGELWMYGEGAGSGLGAATRFYLAADHDTDFEYYGMDVFQDDFRLFREDGELMMKVEPIIDPDRNALFEFYGNIATGKAGALERVGMLIGGVITGDGSPPNAFAMHISNGSLEPGDGGSAFGLFGGGTVIAAAGETVPAAYSVYAGAHLDGGPGTIDTAYGVFIKTPTLGTFNRPLWQPEVGGVNYLASTTIIPDLNPAGDVNILGDTTSELDVRRVYKDYAIIAQVGGGIAKPIGTEHTHGGADVDYVIEIDFAGSELTATYKWSSDGGATFPTTGVPLGAGGFINPLHFLQNNVGVTFSAGTYDLADSWSWTAISTANQVSTLIVDTTNNLVIHSALGVFLPTIGSPTYTNLEDLNTVFHSSGWVSGGVISDAGGATINVTAGDGMLRATDSPVAQLLFFDWSASNGLAITADSIRYIGVEYNAGSPQVVVRTADTFDHNTDFPLGTVVNEAGTLHIQNAPWEVGDHARAMIERVRGTSPISRDKEVGGIIFSETGTRNVAVTAGQLWRGLTAFVISALDTDPGGAADTFDTYSAGGQEAAGVAAWPNTQYDNAGTLTTMTNNRWANLWWYIELDGELVMVYGTNQYTTQAQAENEVAPTVIPNRLQVHGVLAARFIFQKSAGTAGEILSAFDTTFAVVGVTDHGNLAGLGDDDHSQYPLLVGRSGGQTLIGGTGANDDITLQSTSHAARGTIFFGSVVEIHENDSDILQTRLTDTIFAPYYIFRKGRVGPALVEAGDDLGILAWAPYDGAGYDIGAQIVGEATENHSATAHGVELQFFTVPDTTATSVLGATLAANGELQLPLATAVGQGLLLGGDAELYRNAADSLRTPGDLYVGGTLIAEIALFLGGPSPFYMQEAASSPGINITTLGQWWVLNTAPNHPHFEDDIGDDYGIALELKSEVPVEITFPLADPIMASADTHLSPSYEYKNPWVSGAARRMGAWYVKFESNVGGDVTLLLQKNGTSVTGASVTVSSGTSESSVDSFTEFTLADGDTLEVEQSTARTDAIQAVVHVYGYEKIVPGGDTL